MKIDYSVQARAMEWAKINWRVIAWFIGLMVVASVLPRFVHNQFITGPIINATLFLAAVNVGTGNAIMIGLVPSVVALSGGLLPLPLAPMVPFIMISNAVLILVFNQFKKMHFGTAAILASLAKYIFLYGTSFIVLNMFTQKTLAVKAAATMMAWPQLATALLGAVIAFGIIKVLNKEV